MRLHLPWGCLWDCTYPEGVDETACTRRVFIRLHLPWGCLWDPCWRRPRVWSRTSEALWVRAGSERAAPFCAGWWGCRRRDLAGLCAAESGPSGEHPCNTQSQHAVTYAVWKCITPATRSHICCLKMYHPCNTQSQHAVTSAVWKCITPVDWKCITRLFSLYISYFF